MTKASVVLVLCSLLSFATTASASRQATHVRARLLPVAANSQASGVFIGRAIRTRTTVTLRWQLSLARLSGVAKRVTIHVGKSRLIAFTLCAPCTPKAHGVVGFPLSSWKTIVADGAQVVVTTQAHPLGELRGTLKT